MGNLPLLLWHDIQAHIYQFVLPKMAPFCIFWGRPPDPPPFNHNYFTYYYTIYTYYYQMKFNHAAAPFTNTLSATSKKLHERSCPASLLDQPTF